MRDFKKYDIWQLSHSLTLDIYKLTSTFPKEEVYGVTSQIRRASASIATNISEGCGRNSDKEFNQFLNIALGSANETEYLLILSKDLDYLKDEIFKKLEIEINIVKSKIYNLKKILIKQ
jgi:four helix bundle protein